MAENKLADLSMDFAVIILKTTDSIKGHYSLINQLERSATSIGANIRSCGGIGIRARLRGVSERVRVQVPSTAPEKDSGLDTILSLFQLNPPSSE